MWACIAVRRGFAVPAAETSPQHLPSHIPATLCTRIDLPDVPSAPKNPAGSIAVTALSYSGDCAFVNPPYTLGLSAVYRRLIG